MKKMKVMRHCDALAVDNRPVFDRPSLSGCYDAEIEDYVVGDRGVAQKVMKKVSIDPKVEMSKYRVSDFSLENVIAAGAVGNLKEGSLSLGALEGAELAERVLDSYEREIEYENNNFEKDED